MSPDDRRPFRGGAPFDRGHQDRASGPGPGDRPPFDRPGFAGPRPFNRPPTRGGDLPPPDHRVRLRDGDREVEISGSPAFVRQILDELPTLMGRLAGVSPGRTMISMPAPPAVEPVVVAPAPALPSPAAAPSPAAGPTGPLESQVFDVLRGSARPLAISAIRERMDTVVTGQQLRRLLERAGDLVTVSTERPATYSLR